MSDNEIIKALQLCHSVMFDRECENCPLYAKPHCSRELLDMVIDLVIRQNSRIKWFETTSRMEAANIGALIDQAYKEFAEKLKKKFHSWDDGRGNWIQYIPLEYIDNTLTELTEKGR